MALRISVEQLWQAWERVQENAGCAGADGLTVDQFARDAGARIEHLRERVAAGEYRPYPLLRIVVEKKAGHNRTLLVPSVADRILQTAVARQLSRSFEEEFLECSYGYRPGRSVDRAIARIRKCHELGYRSIVDADITSYFDHVDHRLLLERLAARPLGAAIESLLRLWVKAHVWDGVKVTPLRAGVPQGSPISPLLANFYLEDFDRELEKSGRKLIRYADDFVILARTTDEAQQALLQTETLLAAAHLSLNEQKTHIADFEHGFRFLGALFLGDSIWIPWKHEKRQGRILFMARPLPPDLRARYELALPQSAMEMALTRAELTRPAIGQSHERSDDMAFLYLTEQGSILRKAGDRLLVEKDDAVLLDLPYHKLETVLLFGNVQVTTQAMGELLEKGVNMSLFSSHGMYRGALTPPRGKNIDLRIAQFQAFRDTGRALSIARATVQAKIANGVAVLDLYRRHGEVSEDFERRKTALAGAVAAAGAATDIAVLDGTEGAAAREYFSLAMQFNKSEMAWTGRAKHPAKDPLNALLSLTYTLLMNEVAALLEGAGLDPFLGFLHQIDYGRPSLALDVVEPFRHPVADRFVLTMVNTHVLEAEDFQPGGPGHGLFLAPKPMKRYFAEYERWMLTKPEGQINAGQSSFRECVRHEVEKLCAALRDRGEFQPWRFRAESTDGAPRSDSGPNGDPEARSRAATVGGDDVPVRPDVPVESEGPIQGE
jgi:CRISP-associated protein Cas1